MMKILIVGLPRSGTTALYFKVRQALPEMTWCLYEPPRFDPSDPSAAAGVLAKVLISGTGDFDYASFGDFDKAILVVRDPRDHLVSRLLYRACSDAKFRRDDAKVAGFVAAIRDKEADPRSTSILDLLDRYNNLSGENRTALRAGANTRPRSWAIGSYAMALDFHRRHAGLMTYKYEELIAGNLLPIERVLGIPMPGGEALVADAYEHVTRTKGANDWKNWFTETDVAFFRQYLAGYMLAYGYPDDWTLANEPRIRPEHGSEFVRRSVALRRQQDRRS
jgi:hypothetical protein